MTEHPSAAVAPAPAADEPVGASLAHARAAAGLSLEDAARQLKFAPRQLEALERGEWGRLPGGAAVRAMVRNYSRLLGLDADALVTRVGEGVEMPDAERLAQRFRQPIPFSDGTRRSNLVYVVLSIALLAVVAAVAFEWRQERAGTARLTFVSAAQQPAEPAHVALASASPQAVIGSDTPATQTEPAGVRQEAVAASAVGHRRIVLRFEAESWVEIKSGTGKVLVSHLNSAGSERVVSGVPPFSVVIGNAQHVKLTYNDRPVDLMPYVKVEVARFTLD